MAVSRRLDLGTRGEAWIVTDAETLAREAAALVINTLHVAVTTRGRVRELHRRRGDVDDVELVGERLHDHARVIEVAGKKPFPQRRPCELQSPRAQVSDSFLQFTLKAAIDRLVVDTFNSEILLVDPSGRVVVRVLVTFSVPQPLRSAVMRVAQVNGAARG